MSPCTKHGHIVTADNFCSEAFLGIGSPGRIAQCQQRQCDNRYERNRRLQSFLRFKLRALDSTSRFHALMIFLYDPPAFIPSNHSIRSSKRIHGFVREEKPFQTFLSFRRRNFPNTYDPHCLRRLLIIAALCARWIDLDRRRRNSHPCFTRFTRNRLLFSSLFPFLSRALRFFLAGNFQRPLPKLRKLLCVITQVSMLAFVRVTMPNQNSTVMRRPNHESSSTLTFMIKKLERVGTLIADVNELPIGGQRSSGLYPKPAFPRFSLSSLSTCFFFSNLNAVVQHLVTQADRLPICGIHRQTIVCDVSSAIPVANLPQPVDLSVRGVVEFGRIMNYQHRAVVIINSAKRYLSMCVQNGVVSYFRTITESIKPLQILRGFKLIRKRASGMACDNVRALYQTLGSPCMA